MKKFLLFLILIIQLPCLSSTYYISNRTSKTGILCNGGTGGTISWSSLPACITAGGQDLVIMDDVTLNIDVANASCNSLSVGENGTYSFATSRLSSPAGCTYCKIVSLSSSNGKLTFSSGGILTVTGTVNVQNGSGLTGVGTLDITNGYLKCAALSFPASGGVYTYGSGSTIELTSNNTLPTAAQCAAFTQVDNLIISAGTTTLGQALTIHSALTLSGGALDVSASNYSLTMDGIGYTFNNNTSTAGLVPKNGTFNLSGGITIGGTFSTQFYKINITGSLQGTSGHTMKMANNWVNSGSFTHRNNTVEFTSASTISGTTTTNTFYNLIITGTLTSGGGGTTINVDKNWTNNNTFTANSSNVVFQQTNAQSLTGTVDPSFYNLQINKSAGIVFTLGRNITINNKLQVTLGVFDVSTYALSTTTAQFVADGAGEIRFARTGVTLPELTGAYTVTNGTMTFYGNGTHTLRALNTPGSAQYFNLQIGLTTSANTTIANLSGNTIVAGGLTINKNSAAANCQLSVTASNYDLKFTGSGYAFTNYGTFAQNTGTVKLDGTTNLAGSATTTFYDITVNSTGGGGTFVGHATNYYVNRYFTNNGTYTHNSGKITFDNSAGGTGYILGTSVTPFYDFYVGNSSASYTLVAHPTEMQIAHDLSVLIATFSSNYPTSGYGGDGLITFNGTTTGYVDNYLNLNHVKITGTFTQPTTTSTRVFGNWTNNGTFVPGTQITNFRSQDNITGTDVAPVGAYRTQTLGGSSSTTFYKLVYNNPGTSAGAASSLTLNQDVITSVLDLRAGALKLNGHSITVTTGTSNTGFTTGGIIKQGSFSGLNNGSGTGYLVSEDASLYDATHANNAGRIIWTIAAANTGAHIIPFATSTGTALPLTYDLVSGNPGNLFVSTYPTAVNNLPFPIGVLNVNDTTPSRNDNSAYTINRFWGITTNNTTTENITFTYNDPTDLSGITGGESGTDGRGFIAQKWGGTNSGWIKYRSYTSTFNAAANTLTLSNYNQSLASTSPWTLALSVHPLPISLLDFKVILNENKEAVVSWATATESNSKDFEVERSGDGINFTGIEIVKSAGNSNTIRQYTIVDITPYTGISYYRIKQVDFNNTFSFTPARAILNQASEKSTRFFPNPVQSDATIVFGSKQHLNGLLSIYNSSGMIVYHQFVEVAEGQYNLMISLSGLEPGIYQYLLNTNDNSVIKGQFIKN